MWWILIAFCAAVIVVIGWMWYENSKKEDTSFLSFHINCECNDEDCQHGVN